MLRARHLPARAPNPREAACVRRLPLACPWALIWEGSQLGQRLGPSVAFDLVWGAVASPRMPLINDFLSAVM